MLRAAAGWFEDLGGWESERSVKLFAGWTETAFKLFGQRVSLWGTLNEPTCASTLGWICGMHPPGKIGRFHMAGGGPSCSGMSNVGHEVHVPAALGALRGMCGSGGEVHVLLAMLWVLARCLCCCRAAVRPCSLHAPLPVLSCTTQEGCAFSHSSEQDANSCCCSSGHSLASCSTQQVAYHG